MPSPSEWDEAFEMDEGGEGDEGDMNVGIRRARRGFAE